MFKHLALLSFSSLFLFSCQSTSPQYIEKGTVKRPCEKLDGLISAYNGGFDSFKASKIDTRYGRIWKANQHLIGESCQIWQIEGNKTTYSCSTAAPSLEIAQEYYQRAIDVAMQCLPEANWRFSESNQKRGKGKKADFISKSSDLIISTQYAENRHAYNKQWTVNYYIGAPKIK